MCVVIKTHWNCKMNADAVNLVNGRGQCYLNIHNDGHHAQQRPAAFSQMISPVKPAWIVTGG